MGILYDILGLEREGFPVDLAGNPVARTQSDHPYSYDEFVVYKNDLYRKDDGAMCSDRMRDWNPAKFRRCVAMTWPRTPDSQVFHGKKPKDVQAFIRRYLDENVVLTAILQGCNKSSGYPYWVFLYHKA